ncbi:MAG: biotin--[acetyl-CoA-carboxylase] ligase [Candidatus Tectomicrobia bacterium]|nr:biotin--[acetyl-CoA-carboxylase] ligase [Candidatus Tectomicrobia bacterium]
MTDSSSSDSARGELPGITDPLEVDVLKGLLATRTLGRNLRVEAQTASTNDIAKQLAQDGAPDGTVVLADQQVRGRGRQGRSFASPAGVGIYMSLLLRPQVEISHLPQLTLVAGAAAAEAIEEVSALPVKLKWPNDIMIDRRKAGGILTESIIQADQSPVAIVGIGINVNTTLEQFPAELRGQVTSLALAAGRFVPRLPTVAAILGHFEPLYDTFQQSGLAPILPRWLRYGRVAGKPVRCTTERGVEEGVALGLDEDGALLVRSRESQRLRVFSGEVVFL